MDKPALQLSVTRLAANLYHIVVQDEREILNSYNISGGDVLEKIRQELKQLRSMGKSGL